MTFTTVLTIGGVALAGGFIQSTLEVMGKSKYAKLIGLIMVGGLGFFAFQSLSVLFIEMTRTFL